MAWLEAQHLSLYQQGDPLLNAIDLILKQGQRFGIMGATGVGKSRLLAILAKQQQAHEGVVRHALGLRVGYLAEFSDVEHAKLNATALTLWDYAQSALQTVRQLEQSLRQQEQHLPDANQLEHYRRLQEDFDALGGYHAEKRLRKYLKQCLLAETDWQTPLSNLSRAEQQQSRLAMLLTQQPELLILDAPFAFVPLASKMQLERSLKHYLTKHPSALILASHDYTLLRNICKRCYWLREGTLQEEKFSSPAPKPSPVQVAMLLEQAKPYFQLNKGQKIAFFAKDTATKAHFLEALLSTTLRLCYWDKDFRPLTASPWQTLSPYISGVQAEILLQRVGLDKHHHIDISKLSRTQQARLMLAWLQAQQAELIILEHASHHLDLPMRSMLSEYLRRSSASVVLCDDDRQLVQICHNYWQVGATEVISYTDMTSFLAAKNGTTLKPTIKASPSPEQQEAQLEQQLLTLEDTLALPLLEREREKLQNERKNLYDTLFLLYERRFAQEYPPLRSEYSATIAGSRVEADSSSPDHWAFTLQGVLQARMQRQDKVGHIRFVEERACLLPVGQQVLLEAIARIAFERLECHTLQLQNSDNLAQTHFENAGHDWWLYTRHAYERQYYPKQHKKTPSRKRRRKKSAKKRVN